MRVESELCHRFDFYRATVPASVEATIQALVKGLEGTVGPLERVDMKGRHSYAVVTALKDAEGFIIGEVAHGGVNPHPSVEFSGSWSPVGADVLRAMPCGHRPSRVDACCDVVSSGLFDWLVSYSKELAERFAIKRRVFLDEHPDRGSTIYLGSRTSQVFVRLYQPCLKRAEEEGREGDQISQEERDTVRLEIEFKAQKGPAKHLAQSIAPAGVWSVSRWSAELATTVFAMDLIPISIADRRESNRDRALRVMGMQYAKHLRALMDDCHGDLTAFGERVAELAGIVGFDAVEAA
jgi:hypothetical protein